MNTTTILQSMSGQYEVMLNNYAAIVEKTNAQLSLWSNPYAVMIATLGVLFTVGAILAAVIIYWNSREYKKNYEEKMVNFFSKQEEIYRNRMEEKEKSFDKLIEEKENQFKNASDADKEEIKKEIAELKKSKAFIGSYQVPEATIDYMTGIYDKYGLCNPIQTTTCFGCRKNFQYKDKTNSSLSVISLGKKVVYCPHCGAQNYL